MHDDTWMTSTAAAELAGVSKAQLMGAVNDGEVPAYRIGRYYRFRRGEVEAWMRGEPAPPLHRYPQEVRDEAVARYVTGDDPEAVAVALGLSPVTARLVEAWVEKAGHRVR